MEPDPLISYYQQWYKDSVESSRWLRSGEEYEAWHKAMGTTPLNPEAREDLAKHHDQRAEKYAKYSGASPNRR